MALKQYRTSELTKGIVDIIGDMPVSIGHTTRQLHSSLNEVYKFESLCSEGIKTEGEYPKTFLTAEDAVKHYLTQFRAYWIRNGFHGCTLYWREMPTIEALGGKGFYVFSRLLFGPQGLQDPLMPAAVNETPADFSPAETIPQYLEPGWHSGNKGPNPLNKSGFRATGHRVLLQPEIVEKRSPGGLFLPEKAVIAEEQRAVIATVLEIGPDAWSDKSTDFCEVGDRVLIGMYVGKFHESPVDGVTYRFVQDLDIISPLPKVEKQ